MLEVAIEKRLREFQLRTAFQAANDLVVLFGPSGSGKTVTLRSIVGILRPDAGSIRIDDVPVFDAARGIDLPMQQRRIGYVPQSYGLFPHLTVAENVGFGLGKLPAAEARTRVGEMLERLELAPLQRHRPRELSGGQQQRVALARALVTRPRVLLLDEPFSALDTGLRQRLRRDLLRIHQEFGITTVFISHDLGEAYMLASKVVVYDRGRVLQVGSRDEVFQRPASAQVARLTGATNVFSGEVTGRLDGAAGELVAVDAAGLRLQAARPTGLSERHVDVCVRPEVIGVERARDAPAGPNQFPARILDTAPTAAMVTLYCQVEGQGDAQPSLELEVLVPLHTCQALDLLDARVCTLSIPPENVYLVPRTAPA